MQPIDLAAQPTQVRRDAARLLVDEFTEPSGWTDLASAEAELERIIAEGFARAVVDGERVLGWIGGLPEYSGRVWELHPLVVRRTDRRRGIGRALVTAFEEEVSARGALTVMLGTDDDAGMTSLSWVDLYDDLPAHVAQVRDLGRWHPFLFYRMLGYVVSGVVPDANGRGRPDILMAKRVGAP